MLVVIVVRVRTYTLNIRAQRLENQIEKRTQQLTIKYEQLEKDLKQRSYFSKALVHELKTPLSAMVASSSLLYTELKDEPYKSLAKHLHEGANDLDCRINELFVLAKGELGLLSIERKPVNIIKLLSDVVGISEHDAHRKKQNLILKNTLSTLPMVEIDEGRIRQVLFNILDNAIKFTPEGGIITIEVKIKGSDILISIKDTGIGMTMEELSGIFQSYYNADRYKGHLSGLGLGLSISKMFIELHGGHIWAESVKGEGSTFIFSIPVSILNNSEMSNQAI
jgi:signal transduction histidine kinase